MHVVVLIQIVQKLANFQLLGFGQVGKNFWNVADFACDDGPSVG